MSEGKHRFNYRGLIAKIFLACIVILVIVLALGSILLLNIDKHHECYRNFIIKNCLKRDNYYDGEIWFSAAATLIGALISAVPGLMCGILALVQTQRLHSLEARYHRPMMEIEKAGLSFVKLRNIRDDNDILRIKDFDMRQRYGVYEAEKQSSEWWIDLELVLFSNNGIAVKNMDIESVTFAFPDADYDQEYELRLAPLDGNAARTRKFERNKQGERAVYTLTWSLNPFVPFKQCDKQSGFPQSINEFVFYKREGRNSEYSHMNLSVKMNVDYEYREEKKPQCWLKAVFDAKGLECSERNKDVWGIESTDGYFTYEV